MVFRVSPAGSLTTLASFAGPDGASPDSELVVGTDGTLYGLTAGGGAGGFGTAFKLTTSGELTHLTSFTGTAGPAKGAVPCGLVRHGDGFFYGVTQAGGTNGLGTVFRLSPAGTVTTLVEFTGLAGAARGAAPIGAPTVSGTTLYGVTREGGTGGLGSVYKVTTAGVFSSMVEFTGISGSRPGAHPAGSLRLHPDGALYGTTEFGGTSDFGTVFRLTTAAAPAFSSLRSFDDPTGSQPTGSLGLDATGAMYGSTAAGGNGGLGTLYRISSQGAHSVLAHFTGAGGAVPGATPRGGLTTGPGGDLYGVTSAGSAGQYGLVFRMSPTGAFSPVVPMSTASGWMPSGAPVVESTGALLFPLAAGGSGGVGTLVRLTTAGDASVAGSFVPATGGAPVGGLVAAGAAWLGLTSADGASGRGTAYTVTAGPGVSLLANFTSTGGASSEGPLLAGPAGDFFGVSREGGLGGHGTVFKLTAAGIRTRVVSFTGTAGAARGRRPRGPLALAGVQYFGVTEQGGASNAGTIFRISPAGVLTTVAEFTATGPRAPAGGMVAGADGFLYGTTTIGGAQNGGTLFRLDPAAGTWTVLADFSTTTGTSPLGPLLAWSGGFYGLAASGGTAGFGTVFRYTAAAGLEAVASFTGSGGAAPGLPRADDGAGSEFVGGLVGGADGHLYGVAAGGGPGGGGTAFRIRLNSPLAPFEAWKSSELGDPSVPDTADPDADGLTVLLEYALRLQPDQSDVADLPAPVAKTYTDGERLSLILTRHPERNDITLLVQAANDLAGPWQIVASSLAGAPFSGPGYVGGDAAGPGPKTVEIRDVQPLTTVQRRFMRLKINH